MADEQHTPEPLSADELARLRHAHVGCLLSVNANFRHVTIHRLLATLDVERESNRIALAAANNRQWDDLLAARVAPSPTCSRCPHPAHDGWCLARPHGDPCSCRVAPSPDAPGLRKARAALAALPSRDAGLREALDAIEPFIEDTPDGDGWRAFFRLRAALAALPSRDAGLDMKRLGRAIRRLMTRHDWRWSDDGGNTVTVGTTAEFVDAIAREYAAAPSPETPGPHRHALRLETADEYECIACGERFRLVPASPDAPGPGRLDAASDEIEELRAGFDLRWEADMRAIKRWQEAHPGKELVWPDHADLVVWLLEQLDAKQREAPM